MSYCRHSNRIQIVRILLSAAFVLPVFSQTEVTLRQTPSGPGITVNGETVAARMFWGMPGFGEIHAHHNWSEHSFQFTASFAASATLHFRFGTVPGEVRLKDIRLTAIDTGQEVLPSGNVASAEQFSSTWNIWPPDDRNTVGHVSFSDSAAVITLTSPPDGNWPDFHLWSDIAVLEAGTRYRCTFRTTAMPDRNITPTVYHAHNGWTPIGGPPGPFLRQVALARDAGIRFISFIIANCWSPSGEEPDWRHIDAVCQPILDIHPRALLVPRVSLDAPLWWIEDHPDALMVFEDGSRGDKAAVSHREYRTDAAAHLERLCRYLMHRYPDNFAGIHPCGQNTGEWFYEDAWGSKLSGYDPATAEAWRNRPEGGAAVPAAVQRRTAVRRLLLDPVLQKDVIQFNMFLQEEMADFITTLAAAARSGTGGKKLTFFFYGYEYEFGALCNGPAASGHYGLARVLECPDIDVLCGPLSYRDRGVPGTGPVMAPVESILHAGKLWWNEDDTRTYLNANATDHAAYGGLATAAQTKSVLMRNTAQASIRGLGTWLMDHGAGTPGGWLDDPFLWEVMPETVPLDAAMRERGHPFTPEIAVITDESSLLHLAGGNPVIGSGLISDTRAVMGRCGAPYGQYLLPDVLTGYVQAKLQIFLAVWALTDGQREQLRSSRVPGGTRVWCWAPGFLSPDGADTGIMKNVTGFTHQYTNPATAAVIPTDRGQSLGLTESWGATTGIHPLFTVNAVDSEVLAVYSNGDPAVAVRTNGNGADVFVGTPQLTTELIRTLAVFAGVHQFTGRDAAIWSSDNVASVHALEDGVLNFQTGCENLIQDGISDQPLGPGPEISLEMNRGETYILKWQPDAYTECALNPGRIKLLPNFPNPFNPLTTIVFMVPDTRTVSLTVFDLKGRLIDTVLHSETLQAGYHSIPWDAGSLPAGIYMCRLEAGRSTQTGKMVLIK
ncbi:T9SS type A sorting domain-containing protein [bacterium]|nr:T9SS type A sorting domain-containing protein [bacterium]